MKHLTPDDICLFDGLAKEWALPVLDRWIDNLPDGAIVVLSFTLEGPDWVTVPQQTDSGGTLPKYRLRPVGMEWCDDIRDWAARHGVRTVLCPGGVMGFALVPGDAAQVVALQIRFR